MIPTPADIVQNKAIVPSARNSAAWSALSAEEQQDSFTSSEVLDASVLQEMRDRIYYFLSNARDEENQSLRTGSKAEFAHQIRGILQDLGSVSQGDLSEQNNKVTNLASLRRLELIFDTVVASARGRSSHQLQMTDTMKKLFPAFRFVRRPGSKVKRPIHEKNEGEVRLKDDHDFWAMQMNARDIGGFEVPYPPFGFNSNMDIEPVTRKEAVNLGLIARTKDKTKTEDPGPAPESLAHEKSSSIAELSNEVKDRLVDRLNDKLDLVQVQDDRVIIPEASSLKVASMAFNIVPFLLWGLFAGKISEVLDKKKQIKELARKAKSKEISQEEYKKQLSALLGSEERLDQLVLFTA